MEKRLFIEACREGGSKIAAALRTLHRDYGGALHHQAMLALRDEETVRDLVQDTLIKAWQRCASFRGDSELFPWLKTILRHGVVDVLRAQRPQQSMDDSDGQPLPEVEAALRELAGAVAATPEQLMQTRQLEGCFRRCANRFALEQPLAAEVIRWVAEDGLDGDEIAALLERSPGATREYISQCRKKARLYFRDWYELAARTLPGSAR